MEGARFGADRVLWSELTPGVATRLPLPQRVPRESEGPLSSAFSPQGRLPGHWGPGGRGFGRGSERRRGEMGGRGGRRPGNGTLSNFEEELEAEPPAPYWTLAEPPPWSPGGRGGRRASHGAWWAAAGAAAPETGLCQISKRSSRPSPLLRTGRWQSPPPGRRVGGGEDGQAMGRGGRPRGPPPRKRDLVKISKRRSRPSLPSLAGH